MGKKAVTPNSTSRRAQRRSPASSPGSGMQKSAPKPPLSCGAEERCGAAGGRAARVRAQSLAAGTWESAGWSVREHLEVDEPRGENAALAVNSRVRGATLPEELLRIGDRAVPHPQILAFAQLVADEQPAVDIACDGAARRGSLRDFRLSAVLHAKERVHVDVMSQFRPRGRIQYS